MSGASLPFEQMPDCVVFLGTTSEELIFENDTVAIATHSSNGLTLAAKCAMSSPVIAKEPQMNDQRQIASLSATKPLAKLWSAPHFVLFSGNDLPGCVGHTL